MNDNRLVLNPEEDGTTHINIYSKGATDLGKKLSNFYHAPIDTDFGKFQSIEGYWHWLRTKPKIEKRENLRNLWGSSAKILGGSLEKNPNINEEKFKFLIKYALLLKFDTYDTIREPFKKSTLPLTHYYVYGGKVQYAGYEWIVKFLEDVRTIYKQDKR